MKLNHIYQQYHIPNHLAEHMLSVAAIGQLIADSWQGPDLNRELIISTLLVHDIGNLVKFDLSDSNPDALNRKLKNLKKWQQIQQRLQQKYTKNAEVANVRIMQELNFPQPMINLMQEHTFEAIPKQLENQQWTHLICTYADLRIAPHGLVSVTERLQDLKRRYQERDLDWSRPENYQKRLSDSLQAEAKLDEHTQLSLPAITPTQLKNVVKQLTEYEFNLE